MTSETQRSHLRIALLRFNALSALYTQQATFANNSPRLPPSFSVGSVGFLPTEIRTSPRRRFQSILVATATSPLPPPCPFSTPWRGLSVYCLEKLPGAEKFPGRSFAPGKFTLSLLNLSLVIAYTSRRRGRTPSRQ